MLQNVSKLELEIIYLQTDLSLKTKVNDTDLRNMLPSEQLPNLTQMSLQLHPCFGSTCLSESGFSTTKILKSKYRQIFKRLHDSGYYQIYI